MHGVSAGTVSHPVPSVKPGAEDGGAARLAASHGLHPTLTHTTCHAAAQGSGWKMPSLVQLCLFSSVVLLLADRVGRGKDGEENYHLIMQTKREGMEKKKLDANS